MPKYWHEKLELRLQKPDTVVTGACNGVPQAAVLGAQSAGGSAIGFSAYTSEEIHVQNGAPVEGFKEINYIPADYQYRDYIRYCHKYRNVSSVAFVDAAIFINGRIGTINEFTIAYDMGKIIGVVHGSGGAADELIPEILRKINKPSESIVIFKSDPEVLVSKIIEAK